MSKIKVRLAKNKVILHELGKNYAANFAVSSTNPKIPYVYNMPNTKMTILDNSPVVIVDCEARAHPATVKVTMATNQGTRIHS